MLLKQTTYIRLLVAYLHLMNATMLETEIEKNKERFIYRTIRRSHLVTALYLLSGPLHLDKSHAKVCIRPTDPPEDTVSMSRKNMCEHILNVIQRVTKSVNWAAMWMAGSDIDPAE